MFAIRPALTTFRRMKRIYRSRSLVESMSLDHKTLKAESSPHLTRSGFAFGPQDRAVLAGDIGEPSSVSWFF